MSSWEVYIGPGRQSVFLYLTSSAPAKFSAQLCVLNERGCTPMGQIHSVTMVSMQMRLRERKWEKKNRWFNVNMSEYVTLLICFTGREYYRDEDKCAASLSCWEAVCAGKVENFVHDWERCLRTVVRYLFSLLSLLQSAFPQVWQSHPALRGRRILCPDCECTQDAHTSPKCTHAKILQSLQSAKTHCLLCVSTDTHNRYGIYAVAALIFVVIVVSLGIFIHRLTKSGCAG